MEDLTVTKPVIIEETKVNRARMLRVFKRDLAKLIREHEMDQLTGINDVAIAEFLTNSLMSVTRLMDDIYEFGNSRQET